MPRFRSVNTLIRSRNPDRPVNIEAWQRLNDAYVACKKREGKPSHPWTVDGALMLGKLYVEAWGQLPTPTRMRATYAMPQQEVILRLFGSYEAFHAAIVAPGIPVLEGGEDVKPSQDRQ